MAKAHVSLRQYNSKGSDKKIKNLAIDDCPVSGTEVQFIVDNVVPRRMKKSMYTTALRPGQKDAVQYTFKHTHNIETISKMFEILSRLNVLSLGNINTTFHNGNCEIDEIVFDDTNIVLDHVVFHYTQVNKLKFPIPPTADGINVGEFIDIRPVDIFFDITNKGQYLNQRTNKSVMNIYIREFKKRFPNYMINELTDRHRGSDFSDIIRMLMAAPFIDEDIKRGIVELIFAPSKYAPTTKRTTRIEPGELIARISLFRKACEITEMTLKIVYKDTDKFNRVAQALLEDEKQLFKLAGNVKTHPDDLRDIYHYAVNKKPRMVSVCRSVLSNPSCPTDVLEAAVTIQSDAMTLGAILSNPHVKHVNIENVDKYFNE